MRPTIGKRVEVDLFGMRTLGDLQHGTASGIIVALDPGTITVRLDEHPAEVTVGPARLLRVA
jgi:hypothetical protein